jgi:hypothetical protein
VLLKSAGRFERFSDHGRANEVANRCLLGLNSRLRPGTRP